MIETKLHPVPRDRDVLREQIRLVALRVRTEAIIAAIVLGIATIAVTADILGGSAETWFDSDDWFPFALLAFLFPFAVWRNERPFGAAFLWTLPVDRRRIATARALAGWIVVLVALAIVFIWHHALALVSGIDGATSIPAVAFVAVTASYLFGSAVVIGLRHPVRWLLAAAALLFVLGGIIESVGRAPLAALPPAVLADAAPFLHLLALGAAVIALRAAISRHRENR